VSPGLIWLVYRIIGLVELRMIMHSLPPPDRVTAAIAYIGAHPSRARLRRGTACQCRIAVSVEAQVRQSGPASGNGLPVPRPGRDGTKPGANLSRGALSHDIQHDWRSLLRTGTGRSRS
jgi:hypothetical protein